LRSKFAVEESLLKVLFHSLSTLNIKINVKIKQLEKNKLKPLLLSMLLMFVVGCLIVSPEKYMSSIYNGIILWAKAVLPAIFPFFFLTKMLTELGSIKILAMCFERITQKLFKVNGISSYAFIMSIFSGYPVGAKITSELYENKFITLTDAKKMCSFCSTSGPLFIIGTVGVGMLASKQTGIIIFACHIIGAMLNGILWRNYKGNSSQNLCVTKQIACLQSSSKSDDIFSKTVYDSVISILIVGGYISLFCMFVDVAINTGILRWLSNLVSFLFVPLGINEAYTLATMTGVIEITRGCLELSKVVSNREILIVLCTFLISFGGISTHLQSMAFLSKHKIKYGFFLLVKLTQALLSILVAWLLILIFNFN